MGDNHAVTLLKEPETGQTAADRAWVTPVCVTLAALCACAYVTLQDPDNPHTLMPQCPTKMLTGLDCPLCGGLRMVHNLIVGHWSTAMHDNLLLLIATPFVVVLWVRWVFARVTGRAFTFMLSRRWTYALLVLAAVWMVVRNLPGWPLKPGA